MLSARSDVYTLVRLTVKRAGQRGAVPSLSRRGGVGVISLQGPSLRLAPVTDVHVHVHVHVQLCMFVTGGCHAYAYASGRTRTVDALSAFIGFSTPS